MTFRVTTREEAISLGRNRYFTGDACKKGHIYFHRVSDGGCVWCSITRKQLDEEGLKKRRQRTKEYYHKNKERLAEERRLWAKANPHKLSIYRKKDYAAWHKRNPEKSKDKNTRYRAKKRSNINIKISPAYGFEIECIYKWCGALNKIGLDFHVDHVLPLNGSGICGFHVPQNLQVITSGENLRKGSKWTNEEQRFYPLRELIEHAIIS